MICCIVAIVLAPRITSAVLGASGAGNFALFTFWEGKRGRILIRVDHYKTTMLQYSFTQLA